MKNILIIDPAETFAQFAMLILKNLGYNVSHAINAEAGLEIIKNEIPDLVISEIRLQGKGGIELCRILKSKPIWSNIPVIIISTDALLETKQDAKKVGCADFLAKPITARALNELIERHLPFDHTRQNLRARMSIISTVSDGKESADLKTLYMGEGGMYLEAKKPYPVGSKLDIILPLPSLQRPLNLTGEVIYTTVLPNQGIPTGMGLKFIGLDQNTVTLLKHYMESYLSGFLPEPPERE